mmetsp:Transcript_12263/g.52690  ORF Transcript_12263/g.52690 Transcript_12263/m.52690 type:complete len:286 (+) Transcript_12263:1808-2665(+)
MWPLTEVSSSAKLFIALCARSNDALFHTKSTEKESHRSVGAERAPEPLNSSPISSASENFTTVPRALHCVRTPVFWSKEERRRTSSSPTATRAASESCDPSEKYATRRLFSPTSQRTSTPSLDAASLCALSCSASSCIKGPNTFWYWYASAYRSATGRTTSSSSSSSPTSPSRASGFVFHSSSSLFTRVAVTRSAFLLVWSSGTFTSHVRKRFSETSGCHWSRSRFSSRSCEASLGSKPCAWPWLAPGPPGPETAIAASRASSTTASSFLHGANPNVKTFLLPVR